MTFLSYDGEILNGSLVEGLDLLESTDVLGSDKVDSGTLTAETTTTSNTATSQSYPFQAIFGISSHSKKGEKKGILKHTDGCSSPCQWEDRS